MSIYFLSINDDSVGACVLTVVRQKALARRHRKYAWIRSQNFGIVRLRLGSSRLTWRRFRVSWRTTSRSMCCLPPATRWSSGNSRRLITRSCREWQEHSSASQQVPRNQS